MKHRMILAVGVVTAMCAAGIVLLTRNSQTPPAPIDPVAALAAEVMDSSDPVAVVKRAGQQAGGLYILSLGERPFVSLQDNEIRVLETIAREASSADRDALAQGRNAVLAAGCALANSSSIDKGTLRLRRILVAASNHPDHRVRSTFVATCDANKSILQYADVSDAVKRLANAKDANLKISERARTALLPAAKPAPATGPS